MKIGFLAEFRNDSRAALKYYTQAYLGVSEWRAALAARVRSGYVIYCYFNFFFFCCFKKLFFEKTRAAVNLSKLDGSNKDNLTPKSANEAFRDNEVCLSH